MRKFFITSIILSSAIITSQVFSAPKRSLNNKKRAVSVRKNNISGTYNSQTNTYTPSSTNLNIIKETPTETSTPTTCGIPASTDDVIAKRLCATAYSKALSKYCNNTSCKSAIKVAMEMNFGIPLLKDISIDVNGTSCSADNLDKFCSNFADELVSALWSLYSDQAIRERKNCNFAKAKFTSAQDCFNYILAEKNNSGLNNFFSTSKQTELDKGIEKRCGKDAIINNYKKITIDDWNESDENLFFNSATNTTSNIVGIGSNKQLSSNVATQFANIGTQNWNITAKIGNFLDGTWDLKTATYPRDLTVLVNTFITEGETTCGTSFKTDMQDTTFSITNKQSNLEREIAKKGILKGLFDYGINQASAIMGEDWAQQQKNDGIVLSIQKALDKGKNDILYTSQEEQLKNILNKCSSYTESEFKQEVDNILANISNALSNIEKHKHIQNAFINSYASIRSNLTILKDAEEKSNIEIPNYSFTEKTSKEDVKTAITNLNNIIEKLKEKTYICKDGFKT